MRNSYFGFSCSPFENTLDQRFMFVSGCHEEVIAALLYFIRERKSFALVCGDVGTGKTMIVHYVLAKLPRSVLPILIPYLDVEYIEILRYIARVLNINPEGKGVLDLTDVVKAALAKVSLDGKQTVLIMDEAHLLSKRSLEYIRLISNIETTENKLLQTLLIGQNELGVKLRDRDMRQFRQRININRVLCPMKPSETIEYIDHRLRIAGSSFDKCFDPGCEKTLYKMTGGVPRGINRLCDTALLICMTEKGKKVTKGILKKAHYAINSDMVHAPAASTPGSLPDVRRFKAAFAAAVLILFFSFGVLGYRENFGERLKGWFYGTDAGQEANTGAGKQKVPSTHGLSKAVPPPPGAGKGSSSGTPQGSVALPVPSPAPASPEVHPGEAEAAKNRDTGAKANETVSPPVGETGSISVAPQKTQAEEQTGAKNDGAGQLTGERAGQEAPAESGGPDEGARGSRADEEGALQAAEFFTVTVKKGESLNEIAVRWFPEDPESGKKAILSANPQIDDENLLLAGETLRIPGCGEGGSKDW